MNLPKLGHAVIINNIASAMPGSNEDVKALRETYETVRFEVQVHENCTAQVFTLHQVYYTLVQNYQKKFLLNLRQK